MDKLTLGRSLDRLLILSKAAAGAAGIDPGLVAKGGNSVAILGTGLSMEWSEDALGKKRAGWIVRQVYHALDLLTNEERMGEDIVHRAPPDDIFVVARSGVLAVVRRQVEAALQSTEE